MALSEPFVIEVWGEPVGIVLEEEYAFRFYAITHPVLALDGMQFSKPGHARIAAVQLHVETSRAGVATPDAFVPPGPEQVLGCARTPWPAARDNARLPFGPTLHRTPV
jgi:hypothetical protein